MIERSKLILRKSNWPVDSRKGEVCRTYHLQPLSNHPLTPNIVKAQTPSTMSHLVHRFSMNP